MVVNYDLPLMNEREKGGDGVPDIETYIHRIGMRLISTYNLLRVQRSFIRSNGSFWTQGHFNKLRPRQEDMVADGTDRESPWEENHSYRDERFG